RMCNKIVAVINFTIECRGSTGSFVVTIFEMGKYQTGFPRQIVLLNIYGANADIQPLISHLTSITQRCLQVIPLIPYPNQIRTGKKYYHIRGDFFVEINGSIQPSI